MREDDKRRRKDDGKIVPMKKRRGKRGKLLGGTVILAAAAGFAAFVFLTPFFDLTERSLYGNRNVSAYEIWEASGFNAISERMGGMRQYPNFFSLSAAQMERNIKTIPYIETATVTKELPNTITVHVTERTVSGYVDYMNGMKFIYIDKHGMVLEIAGYMRHERPLIVGFDIKVPIIGRYLETDDPAAFLVAAELTGLIERHELKIDSMNVADIHDIRLYTDNLVVRLGSMEHADQKLNRLAGIMQSPQRIPSLRGILDVSDINAERHVFTPFR